MLIRSPRVPFLSSRRAAVRTTVPGAAMFLSVRRQCALPPSERIVGPSPATSDGLPNRPVAQRRVTGAEETTTVGTLKVDVTQCTMKAQRPS